MTGFLNPGFPASGLLPVDDDLHDPVALPEGGLEGVGEPRSRGGFDLQAVNEKIDAVKKAEILMLDDIGAEANSTWIRDEVLGVILQYRMQEDLPTFFSSNFTMQQLEEHLRMGNRGEDEPMKAKRLMERIRFLSREVPMTGKNRRFEQ